MFDPSVVLELRKCHYIWCHVSESYWVLGVRFFVERNVGDFVSTLLGVGSGDVGLRRRMGKFYAAFVEYVKRRVCRIMC